MEAQILMNLSGSLTRSPQTVIVSSSSKVSVNRTSSSSSISLPITSALAWDLSECLKSILICSFLKFYAIKSLLCLIKNTVAVISSCVTDLFSRHFCYIFRTKSTICLSMVEQTRIRSSAFSTLENQILQIGVSFYVFDLPGREWLVILGLKNFDKRLRYWFSGTVG